MGGDRMRVASGTLFVLGVCASAVSVQISADTDTRGPFGGIEALVCALPGFAGALMVAIAGLLLVASYGPWGLYRKAIDEVARGEEDELVIARRIGVSREVVAHWMHGDPRFARLVRRRRDQLAKHGG